MAATKRQPTFPMLDVVRTLLAGNIPTKLESLPGAGKTSLLGALFRASGGYLQTMTAVVHDQTDFGGMPAPDLKQLRYLLLPGEWAVAVGEAVGNYPLVGFFADEANGASRPVMSALLKVFDEGRVGNYQWPPEVRRLMAINPAEANGGVDLTPAMANRCAHVPFHYPVEMWCEGIENGFPDPDPVVLLDDDDLQAETNEMGKLIAAFIRKDRSQLDTYPEERSARSGPFATRRTWTLGARAMAAAKLLGYGDDVRETVLGCLVGQQAADLFSDWYDRQTAIDVGPAFASPDTFDLPMNDDGLLISTLERISEEALKRGDKDSIEAACAVMVRVSAFGRPGMAAAAVKDIAAHVQTDRSLYTPKVKACFQVFKDVVAQVQPKSQDDDEDDEE